MSTTSTPIACQARGLPRVSVPAEEGDEDRADCVTGAQVTEAPEEQHAFLR